MGKSKTRIIAILFIMKFIPEFIYT